MFDRSITIAQTDPELWVAIQAENARQEHHIELIASENYASPAVMQAQGLDLLEEAASSLGAGPWRRLIDVVIPNCRSGLVAGALMVFTLSIGEFNMTLLLHSPFTPTLPVGLADAYASLRIEVGSAYTLIFFVLIVPLLIAMQVLGRSERGAAQ